MQSNIIASKLSIHAKKRAVERLHINEAVAEGYVLFLLHNGAIDQGIFGNARSYLHQDTGIRILVDINEPVVITLYTNHQAPVYKITNPRLRTALENELTAIINDAKIDMDYLSRQLDRLANQVLVLEIESHCCKSETTYNAMQATIQAHLQSMENIEKEIQASMKAIEAANEEICTVCA